MSAEPERPPDVKRAARLAPEAARDTTAADPANDSTSEPGTLFEPRLPAHIIERAAADPRLTFGLVCDFGHLPLLNFEKLVPAVEWRRVARWAHSLGVLFIGAGRPLSPDSGGFYLLAPRSELRRCVQVAHSRMAAAGSSQTLWRTFADATTQDEVASALAEIAATQGWA